MGKVTLVSPYGFKERMLLVGGGGVGKTNAVLSIARKVKGKFWVIEDDVSPAYQRALETDFCDLTNVDVTEVNGWEEFAAELAKAVEKGNPEEDWLVIDSVSPSWDAVAAWYNDMVHEGKSLSEYMVEVRARTANLNAFQSEFGADGKYQFINKEYFEKVYGELRKWKGHLIITAEADLLSDKERDQSIKDVFGHTGVKPKGQKKLHHVTHTVLVLGKRGPGDYWMTTGKDRNRSDMERQSVRDFAVDYLKGVAGWKLKVERDQEEAA